MMEYVNLISKATLTFNDLTNLSERVLGRPHKEDRKVVINGMRASAGVDSISFTAISTSGEPPQKYKMKMIFYNVDNVKKKDKDHPLGFGTGKDKKKRRYFETLDANKHPIRVFCACNWNQFAAEWYLNEADALEPRRKPRPYTRKSGGSHGDQPSPNPQQLPCICKHIYMLGVLLEKKDYLEKIL